MADEVEEGKQINFHFVKTPNHRVIHVDGAHGGVTPHGYIQMTLFSERQAIPQRTTHAIEGQKLGPELENLRLMKDGPIRDCEVTALMDLGTARAVRAWLDEPITFLDERQPPKDQTK